MIIKFGSARIDGVIETLKEFRHYVDREHFIKLSALYELDTDKYLYIRNHSVSELEHWGPNENGDAFPEEELKSNYSTFIGQRVSIDHQDDMIIGHIISSKYIPWDDNIKNGGFVQNILALDKEKTEAQFPGLIDMIINGTVTDTSMGAVVRYSVCSYCGNVAENEDEYCEHIKYQKTSTIVTASGKHQIYEICRGVSFFEDSIIVPLKYGGRAGGEGADTRAKILQVIASKYNPDKLLDEIEASLPKFVASLFYRDLYEALESSNPKERAIFVIMKYSSYATDKGKEVMYKLANYLRK